MGIAILLGVRSLGFLPLLLIASLIGCDSPTKAIPTDDRKPPIKDSKDIKTNKICSFNIQFLGNSKLRRSRDLAHFLEASDCDLVVVQELVAPPDLRLLPASEHYGKTELATFPDGSPHNPNPINTEFFLEMAKAGYDGFLLSPEDTGTGPKNHLNSSATEWFVAFYKTEIFEIAQDLPNGFLSNVVAANPGYDRVPFAFPFRTKGATFDFVLISVHLHPGPSKTDQARRSEEIKNIFMWINANQKFSTEKDYIILGDMNLENANELSQNITGTRFISLNKNAKQNTNTNPVSPKPYDHVFISPKDSREIESIDNFEVMNLIVGMMTYWDLDPSTYPGNPYSHNMFRMYFSDHHPVGFNIKPGDRDDD